ncbi:MAG: sulfatase-like hydrolase/transferase, partial [Vicinamibacteria bacterium]
VSTTTPFTLPSHASIFTGRFPFMHGVRFNESVSLREDEKTLAEVLRAEGFRTAGFAGAIVLRESTGIAQGFEHYDDVFVEADVRFSDLGGVQKRADQVFDGFHRWVAKLRPEERFFAFLHFYDPHAPYEPPARFLPGGERTLDARYRGEIAYVDSIVGKLDALLMSSGLDSSTLLVVTADHGEMLGEHGEEGHGFFVYQPVLHVPLLVRAPGAGGSRLGGTAQLTDIMPTILDLAGVEIPTGVQGVSLRARMEGRDDGTGRTAYAESYFAHREYGATPLHAFQDGTYKYVRSFRPELYDLANDPGEAVNLADPRRRERMERYLDQFLKGSEETVGSASLERLAELEALGYVSGASSSKEAVDAKDRIGEWNDRMRAHALVRERRLPEALSLIQRLREAGADSLDLEVLEARIYLAAGNLDESRRLLAIESDDPRVLSAIADLKAAEGDLAGAAAIQLDLYEDSRSFLVGARYARLLAQQGRVQDAIAFVDQRSRQPKEAAARAELFLDLGAFSRAEHVYSELVTLDPSDLSAQTGLARAMARGGDVLGALGRLEGM